MKMKRKVAFLFMFLMVFWAAPAFAQTIYVTTGSYMAGVTEEAFDKGMDYVVQKDHVALQKLMNAGLVFQLKPGVKVHVMKMKMFSGKVKIRPVGSVGEVWTAIEAVRPQ